MFTQDYFIRLVNCIILTSWTITSYIIVHFLLTPPSRPGFLEAALSKDLLTAAIFAGVLAVNFLPLLPFLQSKVVYIFGVLGVQVLHHLVDALPGGGPLPVLVPEVLSVERVLLSL